MEKSKELSDPKSCLNRAGEHELIFVLRAHDIASGWTVRQWAARRMRLGKNKFDDPEIREALEWAERVDGSA